MSKNLRRALLLVEEFRKINPEMQMQTALAFLIIGEAGEDGIPMLELQKDMGVASSTTSRNVSTLSDVHWRDPKKPGLGLIDRHEDPNDRRNKIVRLSAKGRRVLTTINAIMEK